MLSLLNSPRGSAEDSGKKKEEKAPEMELEGAETRAIRKSHQATVKGPPPTKDKAKSSFFGGIVDPVMKRFLVR